MSAVTSPHPKFAANDGVIDAATAALGDRLIHAQEHVGEIALFVRREAPRDRAEVKDHRRGLVAAGP